VRYSTGSARKQRAQLGFTRRMERVCAYVRCYGQQYPGGDGDARRLTRRRRLSYCLSEPCYIHAIDGCNGWHRCRCRCPKLFRYAHGGGHFGSCTRASRPCTCYSWSTTRDFGDVR
jgi:hypothetical protein